jgi:serralysin
MQLRILALLGFSACSGRVDGADLGGAEPPLADRALRGCDADLATADADGEVDVAQSWSWDDRGQRTTATRDEFADGAVELTLTTTFDDDRRPVLTTGASDNPSNVWDEAWTYGEDGRVATYQVEATLTEDGLLTTDIADIEYTWDGDRVARTVDVDSTIATEYTWADDGLSATLTSDVSTTDLAWDEDGRLVSSRVAVDSGTVGATAWTYDAEGRMALAEVDFTDDGEVDVTHSWTWGCPR